MNQRTYCLDDGIENMTIEEDYVSPEKSMFTIYCTTLHTKNNLPTTINGKKPVLGSMAIQVNGDTIFHNGTNWI